jgi:hypothetical protein
MKKLNKIRIWKIINFNRLGVFQFFFNCFLPNSKYLKSLKTRAKISNSLSSKMVVPGNLTESLL